MSPRIRIGLPFVAFAALALILAPHMAGSATMTAEGGDAYTIDGVHSSAIFRIKHMGVSHTYGRFNDISGSYTIDAKSPAGSSFDIEIKTASVDTNNEARDKHLKSPDFFNAKQFPTIHFVSKSVKADGPHRLDVTGELTMHGVTRPLTVKLTHVGSGKGMQGEMRSGYDTEFKIKRSDYGMNFGLQGVGDDVDIMVALEGGMKK